MFNANALQVLKQCFEKIIPTKDARTTINPLEFIVCLVFCYLGNSKTYALEPIRRFMKAHLNKEFAIKLAPMERCPLYSHSPGVVAGCCE